MKEPLLLNAFANGSAHVYILKETYLYTVSYLQSPIYFYTEIYPKVIERFRRESVTEICTSELITSVLIISKPNGVSNCC